MVEPEQARIRTAVRRSRVPSPAVTGPVACRGPARPVLAFFARLLLVLVAGVLGLLVTPRPAHADWVRSDQWQLSALNVRTAWRYSTGAGVTVAVLDSGVDATHPDLVGQVLPGADFINHTTDGRRDYVGHGTTVAGLIAGRLDDPAGVVGVAPHAKILPVRVLDSQNKYDDASVVADGLRWAVDHGARVVNMSLGGAGRSEELAEAIAYAEAHDVVVIACTGNLTAGAPKQVWYPAREHGVVAVAGLSAGTVTPDGALPARAGVGTGGGGADLADPAGCREPAGRGGVGRGRFGAGVGSGGGGCRTGDGTGGDRTSGGHRPVRAPHAARPLGGRYGVRPAAPAGLAGGRAHERQFRHRRLSPACDGRWRAKTTQLPGRRRESHPPSPTDPDVSLAAHPARAVQSSGHQYRSSQCANRSGDRCWTPFSHARHPRRDRRRATRPGRPGLRRRSRPAHRRDQETRRRVSWSR